MVTAVDLARELESKGGMLKILEDFINALDDLAKKATNIWRAAFPNSRVTIDRHRIGRFYGLFKGIYTRSRPERKKQLEPYLKEFEKLHDTYVELIKNINIRDIERLITEGRRVYHMSKADFRLFLYNLHKWIADVYLYFTTHDLKNHKILGEIYKFVDKMIHIIIDASTEYKGDRPPGAFEFILSVFIHVENIVHESDVYFEPYGVLPVAIAYLIELIEELADRVDYLVVFPGHQKGDWEDLYYVYPFTYTGDLEGLYQVKEKVEAIVSQIGLDVKNEIAILEYLEQHFPAYFMVYDHLRGVVRRELKANLPWDFLKLKIEEIADYFK